MLLAPADMLLNNIALLFAAAMAVVVEVVAATIFFEGGSGVAYCAFTEPSMMLVCSAL